MERCETQLYMWALHIETCEIVYFKSLVQSTHRKMSHKMPLNQCVSSSLCSVGIDEYHSQLQYPLSTWHILWFMYLRWISNFQPLSKPESGIKGCSPRQDKYLPLSSIVGVNLSVDVVVLRSELVCKHNKKQICITWRRNYICVRYISVINRIFRGSVSLAIVKITLMISIK